MLYWSGYPAGHNLGPPCTVCMDGSTPKGGCKLPRGGSPPTYISWATSPKGPWPLVSACGGPGGTVGLQSSRCDPCQRVGRRYGPQIWHACVPGDCEVLEECQLLCDRNAFSTASIEIACRPGMSLKDRLCFQTPTTRPSPCLTFRRRKSQSRTATCTWTRRAVSTRSFIPLSTAFTHHTYSADGTHWTYGGVAWDNVVNFTDGGQYAFYRRERPHFVFGDANHPTRITALTTAVRFHATNDDDLIYFHTSPMNDDFVLTQ